MLYTTICWIRQQKKERIWENFRKSYEGMPIETVEESLKNIVKDSENQELPGIRRC